MSDPTTHSRTRPRPVVLSPLKKPELILVHGFRGSPLGLAKVADYLRQAGYIVHVPAIPPFGGAPTLQSYTASSYARFLIDYIKENSISHPILIGHSMGSIIVAATAQFYPEFLYDKIILMSPISAKPAPPIAALAPFSASLPIKFVDYITTRYLFRPKSHASFREILDLTHQCSYDHPPRRSDLRAAASFSAHTSVADFSPQQKVLLLAGEKDRLVHQSATRHLAEKLDADLVFLPQTGHLHNYEKPQETVAAVLNFLNKP